MGVEAHLTMAHALEHAGLQTDWKPATWLYALQMSFTAFYTVELSIFLRLIVHRHHFFTCANKYWNLFDVVVVLTALYETASGFISFDAYVSIKVAWLRLLRLLKVLKMFRLIRLLRFFRELRTMLASLMGCALALCWSCAVLISLKYLFGLVVIQGLSGYLLDTPLDKMDEATVEGIAAYWGSVPEATLTLYKATTGGSDWSDLASPIREASASSGYVYYLLFLLYVAFFMIALMNVLTGIHLMLTREPATVLARAKRTKQRECPTRSDRCKRVGRVFVDAAIKCRDKDNEEMTDLVLEDARSEDKIGHFKEFLLEQMGERGSSNGRRFSWSVVSDHRLKAPVKEFFKSLHIDYSEARKIFKVLKMEGHADNDVGVDVEEFLQVCEAKLKNGDMVLAALEYETKQLSRSITPILGRMDATMEDVSRRMRHLEESRVSDGGQGWPGTSDWATGGTMTRAGAPPLPSSALVAGGKMGDPTRAPRLETAPHTLQDQPCVLLDSGLAAYSGPARRLPRRVRLEPEEQRQEASLSWRPCAGRCLRVCSRWRCACDPGAWFLLAWGRMGTYGPQPPLPPVPSGRCRRAHGGGEALHHTPPPLGRPSLCLRLLPPPPVPAVEATALSFHTQRKSKDGVPLGSCSLFTPKYSRHD
ncbi:unnamed protein product [Prorocentrum cordatum]|uniref:Ion transport domain-containing protein n=1 Tax=Prorocentrum cordatum TaxID=2364126 RepID=A0ABN9YDF7_9DINO|nr:unnamed protein product [Polarella glacialis]